MVTAPEIFNAIHQKLPLTQEHRQSLRENRGLSDATIDSLGFRSSIPGNQPLLEALAKQYDEKDLLRSGAFTNHKSRLVPNAQLCGFGRSNEIDTNGEPIWKPGVNPILIPYLDAKGNCVWMRPHKGGLRRPDSVDEMDDSYSGAHVYCPYLIRTTPPRDDTLVLTEGELKAAALYDVSIPALAMPGIQMYRHHQFRTELLKYLQEFSIRRVIIVFDNEDKADPGSPFYKEQEWDRYDTTVYAKYTAQCLRREGYDAFVAILPDAWRINGKADWDSSLAKLSTTHEKDIVREMFLEVLSEAESPNESLSLFPTSAQRIIEAKIARLYHSPKCLLGDDSLLRVANKIKNIEPELAKALRSVHGCYYVRKPLAKDARMYQRAQLDEATKSEDWARIAACKQYLMGIPEPISNFRLTCDYRLISASNRIEYLVRLVNIHKEKTEHHVRIGAKALSSTKEFREWTLDNANSTWAGGEKDLQALTIDMQASCAYREIREVDTYGFNDKIRIWKFADVAYTLDGKLILPDQNQVFWHEGVGYQTDFDPTRLGDGFQQGAPRLGRVMDANSAALSLIVLTEELLGAVGDMEGWLAIGAMLGYGIHPELLGTYGGAPGLWLTGRRGGGKTTIMQWLMAIWGFPPNDRPVAITSETTNNFVLRELSKYECLPAWFDEFRADRTRPEVQDLLKNAFNRSAGGKATMDQTKRTRSLRPGTTPCVTGETGATDAATRQRYTQVTILEEKAAPNPSARLKRVQAHIKLFPHLGHFFIQNRHTLAPIILDRLAQWCDDKQTAEFIPQTRARFVAGTPMAVLETIVEALIPLVHPEHQEKLKEIAGLMPSLRTFAMQHGHASQQENVDTSFTNRFWRDFVNAMELQTIPKRFATIKYATLDHDRRFVSLTIENAPGAVPVLYLNPEPVFHQLEVEVRKAGRSLTLSQADLYRELRNENYWVKPPKGQSHRMGSGSERTSVWAFNLIRHPYGADIMELVGAANKDLPI